VVERHLHKLMEELQDFGLLAQSMLGCAENQGKESLGVDDNQTRVEPDKKGANQDEIQRDGDGELPEQLP